MPAYLSSALFTAVLAGSSVAPTSAPADASVAPATTQASSLTLASLLDRMGAMQGLSATFREEKHMSLLAVPLVNEGTVHFARGVGLVRHTQAPAASTVLIRGDQLSVGAGGDRRDIDLGQNPVVRLFVDSIVKIYAGDRLALERMYTMQFLPGEGQQWSLRLVPKLAPMDGIIAKVELRGEGLVLATMEIVERSGDVTVTTFSEVQVDRAFAPADIERLFQMPEQAS
ncbi:MAG: outer membrane lipoprotein carrier protein LolA [Nannocystaceae bacterium]